MKLHKQMNLDLNSLVAEGLRSVAFKSVRNIYPCLEYLNLAGDEWSQQSNMRGDVWLLKLQGKSHQSA